MNTSGEHRQAVMTNVVNLADYRPKTQIKITGKLDSKKVCELMTMDELIYAMGMQYSVIYADGQCIVLDKDDIEAEIFSRD